MCKMLEALEKLIDKTGIMNDTCCHLNTCLKTGKCHFNTDDEDNYPLCPDYHLANTLAMAIKRLEAIDNADSNEALRNLDIIESALWDSDFHYQKYSKELDTIKNYILKVQESEKKNACVVVKEIEHDKENAYVEKIKTMMKQKDCVLRYVESEDCFAVKTILSDGWYKLTPEFVDNNVREEIKPLPLIEKNKQLKEENAKYKKLLDIIRKKRVDIESFYKTFIEDNYDYNDYKICYGTYGLELLTEEEFALLKRWLENNSVIVKSKDE